MKTIRHFKMIVAGAAVMLTATTHAASWRINSDAQQTPDFTDLNAAMSSSDVQDGDTLFLDPGCNLTATQTVSKQVTIIGTGYFRSDAPHQQAFISGRLNLNHALVKVEGVSMTGKVYVNASYVTLQRCRITDVVYIANDQSYTAQYTTIRQCYMTGYVFGPGAGEVRAAYCTIENCISLYSSNYNLKGLYSPVIRNNYFRQTNTGGNAGKGYIFADISMATITNNICLQIGSAGRIFYNTTDSQVTNNVLSAANASYPNNIVSDEATVFTLEGTNDQLYQLKADSPARGAASDGGDCGPFGGATPYVINGLPKGHPYYTQIGISQRAEDGKVNVSLQIQLQDE